MCPPSRGQSHGQEGRGPIVCQLCACSSLRGSEEEAESHPPEAVRWGEGTPKKAGERSQCSHRTARGQSGSRGRDRRQFLEVQSGKQAKSTLGSREETHIGQAQGEVPAKRWLSCSDQNRSSDRRECVRDGRDRAAYCKEVKEIIV